MKLRVYTALVGFIAACAPNRRAEEDFTVILPNAAQYGVALIDRHPISRSQLAACVDDGACTDIGAESADPAWLTRERAEQYCVWRGARLPSDDERSFAPVARPQWKDAVRTGITLEWTRERCFQSDAESSRHRITKDCPVGAWARCARSVPGASAVVSREQL